MADFIDVVKGLRDNKVAADDGFDRLEKAIAGDISKSGREEIEKKKKIRDDKELTFLEALGNGVAELNKNFKTLAKELKTPQGILGGLLGLLISPFAIIFGFFSGIIAEFLRLQKRFFPKSGQAAWVTSIITFFSNIKKGFQFPKLPKNKFDLPKTFGEKLGNFFRSITTALSKPFEKLGQKPFMVKLNKDIKDTMAVFEKAFGKSGFIKGVMDTVKSVFRIILRISTLIGKIFGRFLAALYIPFVTFKEMEKEKRGPGAKATKGVGTVVEEFVNIFILGIPELLKQLLSWTLSKLGFKNMEQFLDKISITKMFTVVVTTLEEFFIDVMSMFSTGFTWEKLSKAYGRNFGIGSLTDKFGRELIESVTTLYNDVMKDYFPHAHKKLKEFFNNTLPKFEIEATKYLKDLFKFREGSTASLVKKFFGDAIDKLSSVFNRIITGLINLARKILPESAQKLLGIEKSEAEKEAEQNEVRKNQALKLLAEKKVIEDKIEEAKATLTRAKTINQDEFSQIIDENKLNTKLILRNGDARITKLEDELKRNKKETKALFDRFAMNDNLEKKKVVVPTKTNDNDNLKLLAVKNNKIEITPVIVANPNESRANELNNNNGVSKSGVNVNNFNDFGDRSSKITNEGDKHISAGSIEQRDVIIKFGMGSGGM